MPPMHPNPAPHPAPGHIASPATGPAADVADDLPLLSRETWAVPGGHRLLLTQHGRADGLPVLVLHGGPGSGCAPWLRRGFDAALYRVICLDQRGAGASQPAGATRHNSTAHLLADLRRLRRHLAVPRWLVVGGSWGATLALAHVADQPEAAAGLLLRASFLARDADIADFFKRSTAHSDAARAAWDVLAGLLPAASHQALLPAIAAQLGVLDAGPSAAIDAVADADPDPETSPDITPPPPTDAQRALGAAWWLWEQALASDSPAGLPPSGAALDLLVARYRVQSHYLRHGCWLQQPSLLDLAGRLARAAPALPMLLLHGTADRVCPPAGAALLHQHLPHSQLRWASGAGHGPSHPAMAALFGQAVAGFARTGDFSDASHAAAQPSAAPGAIPGAIPGAAPGAAPGQGA